MADIPADRLHTRFDADAPLWVLSDADGSYLAAWHGQAGRVLLSWTTEAEMEASLARLFPQAPELFTRYRPEQRPFHEVLTLARLCGCRLRIDEYVMEEWRSSGG